MADHRFARAVLRRLEASGSREALVGDLLEEIDGGRSGRWICEQIVAACAVALVTTACGRVRLTPYAVALGLAAVLLVGAAVAPARSVLTVWLTFYYVAGAVSLFAHMAGQVQPRPSDATSRL